MFTWIAVSLGSLILAGACIIYWNDIKAWALNKFDQIRNKVTKAFANLIYKAGRLYERIFGVSDGRPVVVGGDPGDIQVLSLEELYEAYINGELTYDQYEALKKEKATQVAEMED